jgi:hypothetical protein
MTSDSPTCPFCTALHVPVDLDAFLMRTRPYVTDPTFARCLCEGARHRLLLCHPHTQEGCAGYAWLPQEDTHGR